jgi:hypothetical protein
MILDLALTRRLSPVGRVGCTRGAIGGRSAVRPADEWASREVVLEDLNTAIKQRPAASSDTG